MEVPAKRHQQFAHHVRGSQSCLWTPKSDFLGVCGGVSFTLLAPLPALREGSADSQFRTSRASSVCPGPPWSLVWLLPSHFLTKGLSSYSALWSCCFLTVGRGQHLLCSVVLEIPKAEPVAQSLAAGSHLKWKLLLV